MARTQIIVIVDDLDGTEIDADGHRPTRISLDGKAYELDLSDENRDKLYEALSPFIEKGRRVTTKGRAAKRAPALRSKNAAIREWARQNGYSIGDRGRIPSEIAAAYESAN